MQLPAPLGTTLAAAAVIAAGWLTRHGPRNELWLPWPRVSHPSALQTSYIGFHACHSCHVTAQLTRVSAGGWIVISSGGAALAPELIGRRCRRTGTQPHVGMRQLHVHPHAFDIHDVLTCCASCAGRFMWALASTPPPLPGGAKREEEPQAGAGAAYGILASVVNLEM